MRRFQKLQSEIVPRDSLIVKTQEILNEKTQLQTCKVNFSFIMVGKNDTKVITLSSGKLGQPGD